MDIDKLVKEIEWLYDHSTPLMQTVRTLRSFDPKPKVWDVAEAFKQLEHQATWGGISGIYFLIIDGGRYDW